MVISVLIVIALLGSSVAYQADLCTSKDIFSKPSLECRSHTKIPENVPDTDKIIKNLTMSDDESNKISEIDNQDFKQKGLVNLNILSLRKCSVENIQKDAFSSLKLLTNLDLSYNKIRSLDLEVFSNLDELIELKLNNNPELNHLINPKFSSTLKRVTILDLSHCNLTRLPDFSQLTGLTTLLLNNNKFKTIDGKLFPPLGHGLTTLDLTFNDWDCDCRIRNFIIWTNSSRQLIENILVSNNTKCVQPQPLVNKAWREINLNTEFVCKPNIVTIVSFKHQNNETLSNEQTIDITAGNDVNLECIINSFPGASVSWLKDKVDTKHNKNLLLELSESETEDPDKGTLIVRSLKLIIKNVTEEDSGEYECFGKVSNDYRTVPRSVILNVTNSSDNSILDASSPTVGSWIWILLGFFGCVLLVLAASGGYFAWKRKDRKRQKRLKAEVIEEYQKARLAADKEGNKNKDENGTTPLLTGKKPTIVTMTTTAEVNTNIEEQQGDTPLNSTPQVLNNSSNPYQQPFRYSSASLRRQYFARQHSSPTSSFPNYYSPQRRPPSISSFTSEPPPELFSNIGYSVATLPRRTRLSTSGGNVSPTGSYRSTYSTMTYQRPSRYTTARWRQPDLVQYDNVGPRTTADGGSPTSLHKISSGNNSANALDSINIGLAKSKTDGGKINKLLLDRSLNIHNNQQGFPKVHTPKSAPVIVHSEQKKSNNFIRQGPRSKPSIGTTGNFSFEAIREDESELQQDDELTIIQNQLQQQNEIVSKSKANVGYEISSIQRKKKPPPLESIPSNWKADRANFNFRDKLISPSNIKSKTATDKLSQLSVPVPPKPERTFETSTENLNVGTEV